MEFLPAICRELRGELTQVYWICLIPLVLFFIIMEFYKLPNNPKGGEILKRTVVSIILLVSFDQLINTLGFVSDSITDRINGVGKLMDLLNKLQEQFNDQSVSWIKFREAIIYVFSLCAYLVAYMGIFVASVIIQFVWAVLYVVSPLMILMYVSPSTAHITLNLFKGLINVVVWKILWSVLGIILIKLATSPEMANWDNFFSTILINLCIGFSMLFIPFTTKSLLGDGLTSAASALVAIPTIATGQMIKAMTLGNAKEVKGKVFNQFQKKDKNEGN